MPMEEVFKWAEDQKDRFYVDSKEGTLHKIIKKRKVVDKIVKRR
jgi:hypothetical protein